MGNQPLKKFRVGANTSTIWENEATAKDGSTYKTYSTNLDRDWET